MTAGNGNVGIVDYGMGNIRSVMNALEELGVASRLVSDPDEIEAFDRVILPGVGAFEEAMENLRAGGLIEALDRHVAAGKYLLGVCLGMQLMCRESSEDGEHAGLGWFDAQVIPLPKLPGLKVPHMGWNGIAFRSEHPILNGLESGGDVYFVHSYHVECEEESDVVATTGHGIEFTSMIARDNLLGMQFHPEKSQGIGLKLLQNFVEA